MAKIIKIFAIIFMCLLLQGCAALSALKTFIGSGDNTNKSINTEANIAARDNKKSIISREESSYYRNQGNVTQNGIKFKEGSLLGLIWAGGMGGIDLLLALIILSITKVICLHLKIRQKYIFKKINMKKNKYESKK